MTYVSLLAFAANKPVGRQRDETLLGATADTMEDESGGDTSRGSEPRSCCVDAADDVVGCERTVA